MGKIRVLLADDHAVLRAGLRALIDAQPGMEVVGEAADGEEALRKAAETSPDVTLMDLSMPGMNGLAAIEQIRRRCPRTRVLVLTMHDDPGYARAALDAGASGYVVKHIEGSELVAAVRAVHRGRTYVEHSEAGAEVSTGRDGRQRLLSARERQVLQLLAQGHTNREVAEHLSLSVKTVETYRARLMDKLGLRSRAELVRIAVDMGLQSLPATPPLRPPR